MDNMTACVCAEDLCLFSLCAVAQEMLTGIHHAGVGLDCIAWCWFQPGELTAYRNLHSDLGRCCSLTVWLTFMTVSNLLLTPHVQLLKTPPGAQEVALTTNAFCCQSAQPLMGPLQCACTGFVRVTYRYSDSASHTRCATLQAVAYQAQWQLAQSMCATYHIVSHDHPEVQSHVPRASDRTIVWHATTEDKAFASSLAGVLWSHVVRFASQLEDTQGELFPCHDIVHVHVELVC